MSRRPEPTEQQKEIKRQAKLLEQQVRRMLYGKNRVALRTFVYSCDEACAVWGRLFIDFPLGGWCPQCGQELMWEEK